MPAGRSDTPVARALDAPAGATVVIDAALIERVLRASRASARRRVILPFHTAPADPLQRMLNAVQPGSYIRPHRHHTPPRAESLVVLRGSLRLVTFRDDGTVATSVRLAAGGDVVGFDLRPGVYHTFAALEPDTVVYEVKAGPYDARADKEFAPWSPAEGSPAAAAYVTQLADTP